MSVTLIAAQSLDGFITRHDEPGSAFTSPEDKRHFSSVLRSFSCRIMGANTYRLMAGAIRRSLGPGQLQWVLTRDPGSHLSENLPERLEFTDRSPAEIVTESARRGHDAIALIGGSQIHSLFLDAQCVDFLWITVEARLFGAGTPLLARATDVPLRLRAVEPLSADTLLLKYDVLRK